MKKQKPGWITAVGIIGIILGAFGVLGGLSTLVTPMMIKLQKAAMADMQSRASKASGGSAEESSDLEGPADNEMAQRDREQLEEVMASMEKMFDSPKWYDAFCVVIGLVALLLFCFYIISSIMLLNVSPLGLKLFYTALGLSIVLSLVKIIFAFKAGSVMGIGVMMGSVFSIMVDVVFLIVVKTRDKAPFLPTTQSDDELAPN